MLLEKWRKCFSFFYSSLLPILKVKPYVCHIVSLHLILFSYLFWFNIFQVSKIYCKCNILKSTSLIAMIHCANIKALKFNTTQNKEKRIIYVSALYHFNSFVKEVPSYRNQSIDLLCKSMDWFLYDRDLRHKIIKCLSTFVTGEMYPLFWNTHRAHKLHLNLLFVK